MIKLIITDGDGTLGFPNPSPEMRNVLSAVSAQGITLAVATNKGKALVEKRFRDANLTVPSIIVTPAENGGALKPSPLFVSKIIGLTGVQSNEIAFLGDSDATDIFCAINAGVLPLAATYSSFRPSPQYGLPVNEPKALVDYLESFGHQTGPYFGWECTAMCRDTNTFLDARALMWEHSKIDAKLRRVLKDHKDVRIGTANVRLASLIFHYLVTQCYLSGLASEIDWVTVYPGHQANTINPLLSDFSELINKTFQVRFKRDLVLRHKDAPESKLQGRKRNVFDQFATIYINPDYKKTISHKTVLVLDDFTTCGFSLETARRMLLKAGAQRVVCVAIAKYRTEHFRTSISQTWDPFAPCTLRPADIKVIQVPGTINRSADDYFMDVIYPMYAK